VGNKRQFDNILNECLERLITGQETVEQCLQRYPEYSQELEPLLRTAALMNKAVDVKPSEDFRARARYQMQLKMTESKAPQAPRRVTRVVPRWAVAVCTVMLVFVLGGGTVLASAGSMPGSPLYVVKLTTENIQVKLAGSQEKKAELYMALANERVDEMTWMVNNNKTQGLEAAAQRLDSYYNKLGALALVADTEIAYSSANNKAGQSSAPSLTVAVTTTPQTALMAPPPTISSGATDKNAQTTTEITLTAPPVTVFQIPDTVQRADNAITVTGNQNNTINNSKLMNVLIYNAITQPDKIQQLLDSDKVPESVKPALRRALAASKTGYQNAINNLNNSQP
jgi:hypothetical protein